MVIELVAQGHEVECVCEGDAIDREAFGKGVVFHNFDYPRTGSPRQFFARIRQMRRLIRSGRYDCVDSHNRNASIVGRVAAWLERVPLKVYTAHGFYFHDDQKPLKRKATILLEALLARMTDYTLSQSSEDVDLVVRKHIIPPDRIEHIGNGIDTTRFSRSGERSDIERALGLRTNRFRICSIGRLVTGKGFADLLEAFSEFHRVVPESELMIIGGTIAQDISPFEREFSERVATLALEDCVQVTGLTDRVEDYLAACDLFVLPSYREGLPRSLLEAMSMGVCSAATNIRGCREVITNGETGFLFEPRNSTALSVLMKKLFVDPELRAQVASNGSELIRSRFDERQYVGVQVLAIDRLLGAIGVHQEISS
ncbi:MAG: glycosyltransferase family 4 protein [Lysobacteraceae bacterium]